MNVSRIHPIATLGTAAVIGTAIVIISILGILRELRESKTSQA